MSGNEVKHLAKKPVKNDALIGLTQGETVCGTSSWDIKFSTEDVTCLRCRGTREFLNLQDAEGKPMQHAAAIHFLEKDVARLDATIEALATEEKWAERKQTVGIKTDVLESIEMLKSLQRVAQKAAEIRARKD